MRTFHLKFPTSASIDIFCTDLVVVVSIHHKICCQNLHIAGDVFESLLVANSSNKHLALEIYGLFLRQRPVGVIWPLCQSGKHVKSVTTQTPAPITLKASRDVGPLFGIFVPSNITS